MTPRRLILFAVAAFAAGCAPAGGQYGSAPSARTYGTARTWGTGRTGRPTPPFRGAKYRELELPTASFDGTVVFSADSKRVAVGSPSVVPVWDVESGKPVARIALPARAQGTPYRHRIALSADGGLLATHYDADPMVRYWDVATGAKAREWGPPEGLANAAGTPPSPILAFTTGRSFVRGPNGGAGHLVFDVAKQPPLATIAPGSAVSDAAFSPDGAALAVRYGDGHLRFTDPATGKQAWSATVGGTASKRGCVFSPGGQFVLVPIGDYTTGTTAVLSAADGRELARVPFPDACLSADGRVALTCAMGVLRQYDLWAEREVDGYDPPNGPVVRLVVSPDGKTLAVAAPGGNGRLALYLTPFPTLPPPVHPRADLSREQVAEYWASLGSANEFRRRYAVSVFAARADQTMTVAPERLSPVPDRDRLLVEDLVRNLADPDPSFRDRVAAELTHYVARFRPLLTAARDAAGPGSVRDQLTAALAAAGPPPAEVGAVEALEGIGTPEARKLLTELASGAKGAAVTEAAAASLKRLDGKKP